MKKIDDISDFHKSILLCIEDSKSSSEEKLIDEFKLKKAVLDVCIKSELIKPNDKYHYRYQMIVMIIESTYRAWLLILNSETDHELASITSSDELFDFIILIIANKMLVFEKSI